MLRPYRLERELDRAVAQWLGWLPRWDPATARRRLSPCATCPAWADDLGFDEVPHGALHALTTSLDAVITEHVRRSVSLQPFLSDEAIDGLRDQLRREAIAWVNRQHSHILRALDAYVEPKVQHMAALLLADLGGV
ncbi:hypothetical protein [Amnibacterium setariae]|jgi:hypothetical protein|uniref:Uncharacterized protein n=1 Tax=Amnibacterium setariae TaxID=2306585 RepID=A0A3A1U1Q3_9MICO|nr:hypothetical protein [Amnibacterium setariae]RIX30270.1 hypothetical protein D1781_02175 [Amnibacterium setariae]